MVGIVEVMLPTIMSSQQCSIPSLLGEHIMYQNNVTNFANGKDYFVSI